MEGTGAELGFDKGGGCGPVIIEAESHTCWGKGWGSRGSSPRTKWKG